jgi:hypothetical protein
MSDFKFSRRQVWCSELSSGMYCRVKSGMMMEAVRTSETSVDNYFTWQYIPEGNSEHSSMSFHPSERHRVLYILSAYFHIGFFDKNSLKWVGYQPSASDSGGGVTTLASGHAGNCFCLASPLLPYQHGYPYQDHRGTQALPPRQGSSATGGQGNLKIWCSVNILHILLP